MELVHIDKLTAMALVTTAALLCGLLLIRLRQPAIVGYIVAGTVLGPTGFQVIENTETVQLLAELGVIMLLFLIGIELSLRGFKSVYKTALATAVLQIVLAIGMFWGVGSFMEWTTERMLVFGFATAISSTAVAIKILEETDDLRTPVGRTTVSVLIAQDLAVIPIMLIIGAFGADAAAPGLVIAIKLAFAVGFLGFLAWFLARRDNIVLPLTSWIVSKPEIIPLAALAFCFTCAVTSSMLGFSTAYGAFIAGLIIGNSNVRVSLHNAVEPIQAVLLMVFFLSIGLLIDINYIVTNWPMVLIVLATVTVFKTIINVLILRVLGQNWDHSFRSGVVMAQMGEFSFIIVAAGLASQVISADAYRLMISVIALSLLISPMWLAIARKLHDLALGRR